MDSTSGTLSKLRPSSNQPLAGVIRWDLYSPTYANNTENNGYKQILRNLNPSQYRNRIPFFGTENLPQTLEYTKWCDMNSNIKYYSNVTVSMNGNSQNVMDQEIDYAADAGINYFAFLYYDPTWYSHNLYKSSTNPNKNQVKFCYILEGINSSYMNNYVSDFSNPNYQKVLNGKPLVYVLFHNFGATQVQKDDYNNQIQALRNAYQTQNPDSNGLYIVVMSLGDYDLNGDAYSQYSSEYSVSDRSFNYISNTQQSGWTSMPNKKRVPWVSVGADRRPRVDNPVDWELEHNSTTNSCSLPGNYDIWADIATPNEITDEIIAAKNFISNNPSRCESNTFIIYAWNEHDEGGWICPTIEPGTSNINRSRLDAVKNGINNTTTNCNLLSDGLVLGTWTVTNHPLIARYFHNKWWLTQKIESNPERFVIRGSEMLTRPDVNLSNNSYSSLIDCFEWKYSDFGGLAMPPTPSVFPYLSNYNYIQDSYGEYFFEYNGIGNCSTPIDITSSISNPQINEQVTLTTSCSVGNPVWSTTATGNSIIVSATSTPVSYTVTCQGSCTTSSSKSITIVGSTNDPCNVLTDGLVLGTWTITNHPLVARYFHNKWWLTQRIGSNPDQFVVRASQMLNRGDVSLVSGTYVNLINCFEWKYSDYEGLVPPSNSLFPIPDGYNLLQDSYGEYYFSASSNPPCADYFLTDNWVSATSGYLNVELGKNIGGYDIILGGVNYSQSNPGTGIGTHANSEVIYNLGNHSYSYFKAIVGKEDGPWVVAMGEWCLKYIIIQQALFYSHHLPLVIRHLGFPAIKVFLLI